MGTLIIKTVAGFLNLFVMLCLALFLPAWSLNYGAAWAYLAVFFVPVLLITIYFLKKEPDLIQRRLKVGPTAETRLSQKIIQTIASVLFLLLFIMSGLDHRLHWSHVPPTFIFISDLMVLVSFFIIFLVFKENSYTSAIIEIDHQQKVISTGPYALVRHPMYAGALLLLFCTPVALGSWVAMPLSFPMLAVIALRLLDEEKLLHQSLPGYKEYCQKVRYRLVPYIW